MLGFIGPKDEAESIKTRLEEFLRDHLKLELSPEKTLITHAVNEKARFLGYDIGIRNNPEVPGTGNLILRLPPQKLKDKAARYMQDGIAVCRPELLNDSDFSIVELYGGEYRGIVQFYSRAENLSWLGYLEWVMKRSLLKTLAKKHKTTESRIARQLQAKVYHGGKILECFQVEIKRPDKRSLLAQFGGLRLLRNPFADIVDLPEDLDRIVHRNELLERLLADTCELCGSRKNVEVHHIRKLSDLNVKGRKEKPTWLKVMAARKRKTLVVCAECHDAIHAGRPTRIRDASDQPLESRVQ